MELIKKWLTFDFSKSKTPEADFLEFAKDLKCYLGYILGADMSLLWFYPAGFGIKVCIQNLTTGCFANIQITGLNAAAGEWTKNVYVRFMANPRDYTGGNNKFPVIYCEFLNLRNALLEATEEKNRHAA